MTHVEPAVHHRQRAPFRRRIGSWLMGLGLTGAALMGVGVTAASAATVCDPGGDTCVVTPDTVQTPLGLVSVTVSASNTVTVHLDPTSTDTLVVGVAFTLPAAIFAVCTDEHVRTTISTSGGLVTIDTIQLPPGPPCHLGLANLVLPNLAIISLHPPGPCRVRTTGTTVVFTPRTLPEAA